MPEVAIIMGSKNDYDYMKPAEEILIKFGVSYEKRVVSAHRTPEFMMEFAKEARGRGVKVIIAAAGGAAHLPGMTASLTTLPVIGVPIPSKNLKGLDSLLSIVQMPFGVPVATVAIDGARNAALLAIRILGLMNDQLNKKLEEFREEMKNEVLNTSL
jgi:phosphoribosylaminoimidazole carboxylase, PurE protein